MLRSGNRQEGLDLLRKAIARDPGINPVIALSLAYLWLGDYSEAWHHLREAIQKSPPFARLYGLAGVAKWCMDDSQGAMQLWSDGLTVSDTESDSPKIHLALLMMAAAILKADYYHKRQAAAALSAKLLALDSQSWPALLANIVLGFTQDLQLVGPSSSASEINSRQREWLTDLYRAIRKFDLHLPAEFDRPDFRVNELKGTMLRLTSFDQANWADPATFSAITSQEEFFLARHLARGNLPISSVPSVETSPFEMLRSGRVSEGMNLVLEEHKRNPSVSNTMSLGVAYLWIEDYQAAWNHFQDAIKNQRWTHDSYYEMAGTAKWCLNEPGVAVECWKSGLRCDYGDAAGSVGNQLLLFAASILQHSVISPAESIALLESKVADPRIRSWPGPLVELCLGKTNLDFGLQKARYAVHSRRMMIGFYKTLLEFRDGILGRDELNKPMRELTDASQPEWTELKSFTSLLWNAEFFIARYESRTFAGGSG